MAGIVKKQEVSVQLQTTVQCEVKTEQGPRLYLCCCNHNVPTGLSFLLKFGMQI